MITVRIKTSMASPDFKYEFEGLFTHFLHLPRRGELIKYGDSLYHVQDIVHEDTVCPVLYVWQYCA